MEKWGYIPPLAALVYLEEMHSLLLNLSMNVVEIDDFEEEEF